MKTVLRMLLLLTCLSTGISSHAAIIGQMNEDIDIFLLNASVPAERPNVLIIWDNTANWGQNVAGQTAYDLEKAALAQVINNLPVGPAGEPLFNVGLMLFTETGGGNDNVRGTYVRYHIRPMNAANKKVLSDLISSLDTINDRGSNAQYAKAYHEAYLYFGGQPAMAGAGQLKKDCAAFGLGVGGGPGAKSFGLVCDDPKKTTYVSPIADGCQKNYIIFISNGTTDNGENNDAQKLLAGLKGVGPKDPIPLNPSNESANWSDEYARWMAKNDINPTFADKQTAKSFSIAVYDKAQGPKPDGSEQNTTMSHIALGRSRAQQGEGEFFSGTDLSSIVESLSKAFARIKDVDGVFASTTLPVSINVRGTQLNQLYMGVFRPDPGLAPRWPGNLKMYKLALDTATNTVFLADADGNPAENATSGFINGSARSHWTANSTFWSFHPDVIAGNLTSSDNPDGPVVDRGAVAQGLRTTYATDQSTRKLYTCTGTCGLNSLLSLTPFDTANADVTQGALGAADAAERTAIINWVRGQDLDNENANTDPITGTPITTDARASIHGDVLHSRPAVINYNRNADDNDIYAFYGANDGIFRAVKGGNEAASNPNAGQEAWGFIPTEFFGKLKRVRTNLPVMSPTAKRGYFADGPVGVYQKDANNDGKLVAADGDKVNIFIGMRRGGRLLYALDVSDPVAPKMLWKKDNTNTGYGEMGYTFSEPKVARIRATNNPVLIMAWGYDLNQDNETVTLADTMGRGVAVIDATDGTVLWQAGPAPAGATNNLTVAGMKHSISSDVTILNRDGPGDPFIDRLYVGDNGGNLWRIDINDANPANWAVNKLASIAGAAAADKRKFQFPPDVVFNPGASPNFDSVLIGSGDREHPFDVVVANRYYMFKDPDVGLLSAGGAAITEADLFNVDNNLIQVGTDAEKATAQASLDLAKGWILSMATGEKVISSSVTLAGTTFFNTNQPTSVATAICSNNLGVARQYSLSFEDATATIDYGTAGLTTSDRSTIYGQGGFLPSPVPVMTQIGPDNRLFQVVVAGTKVSIPPQAKLESRYRTYWYMKTD